MKTQTAKPQQKEAVDDVKDARRVLTKWADKIGMDAETREKFDEVRWCFVTGYCYLMRF